MTMNRIIDLRYDPRKFLARARAPWRQERFQ